MPLKKAVESLRQKHRQSPARTLPPSVPIAGVNPTFGGSQTRKLSRPCLVQHLRIELNRVSDSFLQNCQCGRKAAALKGDEGITNVIAAHFDDVQGVRRSGAARVGEELLHLIRQVEVAPVVIRARGADGIVSGPYAVRSERRPNAASQTKRAGELLDPGGPVAEMVTAARVGGARNEQGFSK